MNYLYVGTTSHIFAVDLPRHAKYGSSCINKYMIKLYFDIITLDDYGMYWVCCENIHNYRGVYEIRYASASYTSVDTSYTSAASFYVRGGICYDDQYSWTFKKNLLPVAEKYYDIDLSRVKIECPHLSKFKNLIVTLNKFCCANIDAQSVTYGDILRYIR